MQTARFSVCSMQCSMGLSCCSSQLNEWRNELIKYSCRRKTIMSQSAWPMCTPWVLCIDPAGPLQSELTVAMPIISMSGPDSEPWFRWDGDTMTLQGDMLFLLQGSICLLSHKAPAPDGSWFPLICTTWSILHNHAKVRQRGHLRTAAGTLNWQTHLPTWQKIN